MKQAVESKNRGASVNITYIRFVHKKPVYERHTSVYISIVVRAITSYKSVNRIFK